MQESRSLLEEYLHSLEGAQLEYAYEILKSQSDGLDAPLKEETWAKEVRGNLLQALLEDRDDAYDVSDAELLDLQPAQISQLDKSLQDLTAKLVDTSARNRLISFKAFKSSSLKLHDTPFELWYSLESRKRRMLQPTTLADGSTRDKTSEGTWVEGGRADVERSCVTLARALRSNMAEKGLHTLYLGLTALTWVDGNKSHQAPLLLLPVKLTPNTRRVWMVKSAGEIQINPALKAFLKERYHVTLPGAPFTSAHLADFIKRTQDATSENAELSVDPTFLHLMITSFAKEAMHEDISANKTKVRTNPLIQALLSGVTLPPSSKKATCAFLPLDADPSQKSAVEASLNGESFVMFGPPGTGKSQTITNIIAESARVGKRVLFVSEKKAALEAVHDNLKKTGLDGSALVLHGTDVNRREVSESLLRAINAEEPWNPLAERVAELTEKEEKLQSYAEALNKPLKSLGKSFYQLVGEMLEAGASLHDEIKEEHPSDVDVRELSPKEWLELKEDAKRLTDIWDSWRESNPWAQVNPLELIDTDLIQVRERLAGALTSYQKAQLHAETAGKISGLNLFINPANHPTLSNVIGVLQTRPGGVTPEMTADVNAAARKSKWALEALSELQEIKETLQSVLGANWDLPATLAEKLNDTFETVQETHDTSTILRFNADEILSLRGKLEKIITRIHHLQTLETELREFFKEAEVTLAPMNFKEASSVTKALKVLGDPRNHLTWDDPSARKAFAKAFETLKARSDALKNAQATLSVFEADLLNEKFKEAAAAASGRKKLSWWRKEDRQLRKTLLTFTKENRYSNLILTEMSSAVVYYEAKTALTHAERRHQKTAGVFYQGAATNWEEFETQIETLNQAAETLNENPRLRDLSKAEVTETWQGKLRSLTDAYQHTQRGTSDSFSETLAEELTRETQDLNEAAKHLGSAANALKELAKAHSSIKKDAPLHETLNISAKLKRISELRGALQSRSAELKNHLGELYLGEETSIENLKEASEWVALLETRTGGKISSAELANVDTYELIKQHKLLVHAWESSAQTLKELSTPETWALTQECFTRTGKLPGWVKEITADKKSGPAWREALITIEKLAAKGHARTLGSLRSKVTTENVQSAFLYSLLRKAVELSELELSKEGVRLNENVLERAREEFVNLDAKMSSTLAANQIKRAVLQRWELLRPDMLKTEKLITREASKKTRHKHLRELFNDTNFTRSVQTLKPCLMMSPLSVSQYLPPNVTFDLIIFDEASQVRPEDALSALYRGTQMIIAGDSRQMPPTDFFNTNTESLEESDWEENTSLLDMAQASPGIRTRPLQWHYRSQHESLIFFSSKNYYQSQKMVVFPSPKQSSSELGVKFHHVPNGMYERAGARVNRVEAEAVVEKVLDQLKTRPFESVGVVAFSSPQADLIEDLLETRAGSAGVTLNFDDPLNGLFVKNLENVQGDERDVIFLSVGYGPDKNGRMPSNFGPLSRSGGERRLNVAITRAKKRLEVISSLRSTDIAERLRGGKHLREYLSYAENGVRGIYKQTETVTGDAFKQQVLRSLRSSGFSVEENLEVTGFSIAVAVRDPKKPGTFKAAIEFDGEHFLKHPQTQARERLIRAVMRRQGWEVKRLWSSSWARDWETEMRKLISDL